MKLLIVIIAGIFITVLAQIFLPVWWIFAPLCFIISLIMHITPGRKSFFTGLIIVFVSWFSIYLIKDLPNDSLMSTKMANVFTFKSNYLFFFATSLVMGLIGGFASLSAYYLRKK